MSFSSLEHDIVELITHIAFKDEWVLASLTPSPPQKTDLALLRLGSSPDATSLTKVALAFE